MLSTSHIRHRFDATQEISFPDIEVNREEALLVLGRSGTGKTTLLHIIAGLLPPSEGKVTIADKDVYALSNGERDKLRGEHIGIVFQKPHFVSSLTASQNLALSQSFQTKHNKKNIRDVLERLSLGHRADADIATMSQGELQRLAMAKTYLKQPSIILADEPTSALDDGNTEMVISLFKELQQASGSALVIVTHDKRLKDAFHNIVTL